MTESRWIVLGMRMFPAEIAQNMETRICGSTGQRGKTRWSLTSHRWHYTTAHCLRDNVSYKHRPRSNTCRFSTLTMVMLRRLYVTFIRTLLSGCFKHQSINTFHEIDGYKQTKHGHMRTPYFTTNVAHRALRCDSVHFCRYRPQFPKYIWVIN
jgi:hypothetical protein